MLVSTIIPVFNREQMVLAAIQSVIGQSYRPIEIILVDDGSTDNTPEVLEEVRAQYPDIVQVIRQENAGPGVAREFGRKMASGDYIQYLDSDDRLLPNKFKAQVQALEDHPDCDIAYGKTRLVNESGAILKAPYKLSGERQEYLFPQLLVDRWWNTHTPLYRKAACDRVGAWPAARMSEDWQYDARFGGLNTKLVYCDEYVSEHVQHPDHRLTSGTWTNGKLADVADLLPVLFDNAKRAGVPVGCPEMQHFSRWAFSMARQLAARGCRKQAGNCLELAVQSDSNQGCGKDYKAFRLLCAVSGWKVAGHVTAYFQSLFKSGPGPATLKQAWE